MPDLADDADGQIELLLTDSIRRARGRAALPSQTCLNCGEDLSDMRRTNFCDAGCRDDFDIRERQRRIGGE